MYDRPNHHVDESPLILPNPLPLPPKTVKAEEPTAQKRSAPDDDDEVVEAEAPPAKRVRTATTTTSNVTTTAASIPVTPSKKRKLDEDGILLLETPDEKVEADVDVIEID